MSETIWCLSVFAWLISLTVMPSRSILATNNKIPFFFYDWIIFLCVYVPLFLYLSIHLQTHIHILTVVNNTSMNMISFPMYIYPKMELLDHTVVFIFLRNIHTVFHSALPIFIVTNCVQDSLFSPSSIALISFLFDDNHPNLCAVISHCGFNLQFPDD